MGTDCVSGNLNITWKWEEKLQAGETKQIPFTYDFFKLKPQKPVL